tara:strand:- start:176 stop:1174 length:999 start_codon:yes stop_codon:yes gene_type:complete
MNRIIKYLIISILFVFLYSCSSKEEVLVSNLEFEGNCCNGQLTLYDNFKFKISYTTNTDDLWGNTLKGNYKIDGNNVILKAKALSNGSGGFMISEVGDLFTNKYRFEDNSLIPLKDGFSNIKINSVNQKYFRLPCGFENTKKTGTYDLFLFNFCDSLLEQETIHMNELNFNPLPHINSANVKLLLPKNIKLENVYRYVYIYPTIWSDKPDNIAQFMQLDELVYKSKRKLIYKKNTFFYPEIDISKSILKEFEGINQNKLREAVLNELSRDKLNAEDRDKWLAYVNQFNEGDFSNENSDFFKVNYHEIVLVVQLNINGDLIKKTFKAKSYYGN